MDQVSQRIIMDLGKKLMEAERRAEYYKEKHKELRDWRNKVRKLVSPPERATSLHAPDSTQTLLAGLFQ